MRGSNFCVWGPECLHIWEHELIHLFYILDALCKSSLHHNDNPLFFVLIQWDESCFCPGVHLCGLELSQEHSSSASVLTKNQAWGDSSIARWFLPLRWCGSLLMSSYSFTSVSVTNVMTRRRDPCCLHWGVSVHEGRGPGVWQNRWVRPYRVSRAF